MKYFPEIPMADEDRIIWDLREKFNEMSEDWWSAGWVFDLEFFLWRDLQRHKENKEVSMEGKTGHAPLYRDHDEYRRGLEELEEIAKKAGGWLRWPEEGEPGWRWGEGLYIPMNEWEKHYIEKMPEHMKKSMGA